MWIQYERFGDLHDRYLLSIGRALLLSQSFEDMCKRTLIWWNAAKRISEGQNVDLDRMAKQPEHFMEAFLGIALQKLVASHTISEKDAKILKDAKDARNYIAHKAASPCLLPEQVKEAIEGELVMLSPSVSALAEGHNLLACWAYEFEERKPRPFRLSRFYPQQIAQWVMSPVHQALENG